MNLKSAIPTILLAAFFMVAWGCGLKPPLPDSGEDSEDAKMWQTGGYVGAASQNVMAPSTKPSYEMEASDFSIFEDFNSTNQKVVRDVCMNPKDNPGVVRDVPGCFLFCSKFSLNALGYDPSKTYKSEDFADLKSYCQFLFYYSLWAKCVELSDFRDRDTQLKDFVSGWGDQSGELSTYTQRFKDAKFTCEPLYKNN